MIKNPKLMNLRPAIITAISVVFGILFSYVLFRYGLISVLIPAIFFAALILSVVFCFGNFKGKIPLIILSAVFFAFSAFSFYFTLTRYRNAEGLGEHYYSVTGRVKSTDTTDYGAKIVLTDIYLSNSGTDYDLTLYVYGEREIEIGDKVRFSATVYDEPLYFEGELSAENIRAGRRFSAKIDADALIVYGNYRTFFEDANLWIRNSLKSGLDAEEFSVAYAMLTGDDSFIDTDVINGFRSAGVAHVFAVSGLHIGFVALILTFIFKKLRLNEILAAVITVLILVFYAGVCGFSASSLRATITCAVLLISKLIGKRYDGLSAAAVAMTLVLLISPAQLFCVGFQLSFSVFIFITLFTRPLSNTFKFLPKKIADSLGVVISAFLAGIPVSLISFGKFSLVAIPFNLLFIPVVGVVFILLFVLCVIGGIFSISSIVLLPLNYVFKAIVYVITFFDYGALMVGGISLGVFTAGYYLSFFFSSGLLNIRRSFAIISSAVFMAVFLIGATALTVSDYNTVKCYVTGGERFSAAVITCENDAVMVVADVGDSFSLSATKRLKERKGVSKLKGLYIIDENADEQVIVTKIYSVMKIERVYIYCEENPTKREIIEKSFPGVSVVFIDDTGVDFGKFSVGYDAEGGAVVVSAQKTRVAFFRKFGLRHNGYEKAHGYFDVAVGIDYLSEIKTRYDAGKIVSFIRNGAYPDGETEGIYSFSFA